MKLVSLIEANFVVSLNRDEIQIIIGAIREAKDALEDWEFPIRMGATIAETNTLQQHWKEILGAREDER